MNFCWTISVDTGGGLLRQKSEEKFAKRKIPESSHGIGNLELFDDGRITRRQNAGHSFLIAASNP